MPPRVWVYSFASADLIAILTVQDTEIYSNTARPVTVLDIPKLAADLKAKGKSCSYFSNVSELKGFLLKTLMPGDLLVLMSNGDFGDLPNQLVQALGK